MPAIIRILDGPQAGASRAIGQGGRITLGRGETTDLHVLDAWASREHCTVAYAPEGIILEDLHSKNGTYVSGQRVDRCRLPDGSIIQIGTTTVQVLLHPTQSAAAALAPAPSGTRRAAGIALLGLCVLAIAYGGMKLVGPRLAPSGRPSARSATTGGPATRPGAPAPDGTFPVSFTSEPAGATVFIDDAFLGTTPLDSVLIEPGEHTLRVQKGGYAVHTGLVTVPAPQPIHLVLRLAQTGSLDIQSTPPGATVALDGNERGKTPLRLDNLQPRVYTLRLLAANCVLWERDIEVLPAETTTIAATLVNRDIARHLQRLKADPNNVALYSELAHLYLLQKDIAGCMRNLAEAITISYHLTGRRDSTPDGSYRERLEQLIRKIYLADHFEVGDRAFLAKARAGIDAMLADLAAQHPDSSSLLELARRLYKGSSARMIPIYVRIGEAAADDPERLDRVLDILRRAGEHQRAAELVHKLVGKRPNDRDLLAKAIVLLQRAGQHKQAEELVRQALKTVPNDYRLHLFLGRLHVAAKESGVPGARAKAIAALNQALRLCTDDAAKREIRSLLGRATR